MAPRITYGNYTSPRLQGLMGLSFGAMAIVFSFIIINLIVLIGIGPLIALISFSCGLMFLIPAIVRKNYRMLYVHWGQKMMFKRAKRTNRTKLINGPAGLTDGAFKVPGIGFSSRIEHHTGPFGEPMGVIIYPAIHHYVVVLEAYASGLTLVDQGTIDHQVAQWGAVLAHLGTEPRIVGAAVTVETSRDPGTRVATSVQRTVRADAPEFSRAVVDDIVRSAPGTAPQISTRIAITYTSGKRGGITTGDITADQMITEIRTTLPSIMDGLKSAGAGHNVRLCSVTDIVDATRVSFDPTVTRLVEEMRRTGEGTGLTWAEAGPHFAQNNWDYYQHERMVSRTWTMAEPPNGTIYDSALQSLMAPDNRVERKRVTMVYRAEPASRNAEIADQTTRNSRFVANQPNPSKRALMAAQAADKAAVEEASGAGFVRFGAIVTVTVSGVDQLAAAQQVIQSQSAHARLRLRVALGSQDTAFLAGLPLGIVMRSHQLLPIDEFF